MNKKSLRVIVNNIRQEAISCRIAFDCSRFNWFTKDELGITENARQKDISDRNEYYDKANETQKLMLEWLDGISEKLNARHYKVKDDGEFQDIMKDMMKEGDVIISAPIKSVRRAVQKVLNDYNGDWSRLLDGVRATIAVDTLGCRIWIRS